MKIGVAARLFAISAAILACGDNQNTTGAADPGADPSGAVDASGEVGPGALEVPPLPTAKVTVEGARVLDALGREVLLRGVNTGGRSKLPPFFPFPFAESGRPEQADAAPFAEAAAEYLDRVVAWGHNTVRVPFAWEAVEPTRGSYDEAFLARYELLLTLAGERGLRAIVDFHQDVFARPFCGDGFPLWAAPGPLPEIPEASACHGWFNGYFTEPRVALAFDRFWAGEDGLMDAFEAMWTHVAGRLWALDNVVGFEVINEPGWGSADETAWARDVLTPFYTRMVTVVRAAAPGAPVLFDATGLDAVTQQTALERPGGDGLVFAPHFYIGTAILAGHWGGDDDITALMGEWRKVGDAWQVPVLVGEFGLRADGDNALAYHRANWDALDASLLHGTAWEYSTTIDDWNEEGMSFTDPGGAERATAAELVRAYPQAVAGRLSAFAFDREALSGELRYVATAGGVTEVRVPTRLYPDGVAATFVEGAGETAHRGDVLLVRVDADGPVVLTFGPP